MKRLLVLTPLLLSVALLGLAACDREITQQGGEDDQEYAACFTCHGDNGEIEQARGEWEHSMHASGTSIDYTNRPGSDCSKCHNHGGFLDFLATGSVQPPYDVVSSIHCFTCHNPHETGTFELRTEAAVTLVDATTFNHGAGNLCANCHQMRTGPSSIVGLDTVKITNRFGPHHGPQANLLAGSGGYEFEGEDYGTTNHSGAVTDACIGCHMGNVQIHDGYGVGGHSFNMEDEEGNNLSKVCADTLCHGASATSFDYDGIQTEVDSLMTELRGLLVDAGLWNDGRDEPATVNLIDTLTNADLAGALFNYVTIKEDRSEGVHNPAYIVDLLETSIAYLEAYLES